MLDYIRVLLSSILAISLIYMFLDCEFKNKKKLYLLVLFEIVVLICDILVLKTFGFIYFMRISVLLVQFPVFLAFACISKFKAIKVFFVNLTVIAIASSLSLIGFVISHIFVVNKTFVDIG